MTVFNIGSINIDHVYQVSHFVRPGETLTSNHYQKILGGKGANQSIALARANASVKHVGAINQSDQDLVNQLAQSGVGTALISHVTQATGHAIIQVNQEAENAIVLFAGANHAITGTQLQETFAQAQAGDWVLLQNETNGIDTAISLAKASNLQVAFNPAPMDKTLVEQVIEQIDLLIVNEVEAMDLFNVKSVEAAQRQFSQQHPQLAVIITLGSAGVRYLDKDGVIDVAAFNVQAIDTTAAGDTFIGYCLAGLMSEQPIALALRQACAASALCVTQNGASTSIPTLEQVTQFLEQQA